MSDLAITVRYAREMADADKPCREENFQRGELAWSLPVEQCALVLVDCWGDYPIETFAARSRAICRDFIKPVLRACRDVGMTVIHAPSGSWAANYPEFYKPPSATTPGAKRTWPTAEFTMNVPRCGDEPVYQAWFERVGPDGLRINRDVEPAGDDLMIAAGDELAGACEQRRLLHLLYVGFCTNICVQHRDYGMRAMAERGYNCILLRDCTTGIEVGETADGLWLTRGAIANIEMKVGVSTTAAQVREACERVLAQS